MRNKDWNNAEDLDMEEAGRSKGTSKKGKFNIVSVLLILVGVICIGVAAGGIFGIIAEYQKAASKYDDLETKYVQTYVPDSEKEENTEPVENTETVPVPVPWYEMISVDLAGLQAAYPDIKGWIFFENEDISYPVLKGENNDTYIRSTYDGKKATAGSIFIGEPHSEDFSDTHTLVYGHNMKNLSMFGKLKYYKTQEGYYETHKYFQIFRGNEVLRYQIFAYQEVPVDSFVYTETHSSARVLANRLSSTSMVDADLDIQDSDKIITLSTCTEDDDHRFIVSAVLVESYTRSE